MSTKTASIIRSFINVRCLLARLPWYVNRCLGSSNMSCSRPISDLSCPLADILHLGIVNDSPILFLKASTILRLSIPKNSL